MKIKSHACELRLANPWRIAGRKGSGTHRTVIVELTDGDTASGIGEAAPSVLYGESVEAMLDVLAKLDAELRKCVA